MTCIKIIKLIFPCLISLEFMVYKSFNIPILYFLIFLISKEVFSYDGEKVVILCILSFLFLAYFNLRESIAESFLLKTNKLEEEYKQLADLKLILEKEIYEFWTFFNKLEIQLFEIFFWIKSNIQNYIKKANKNRTLLVFHIIKDQLNVFLKDYFLIKYFFKKMYIKKVINNINLILSSKIEFGVNNLNLTSSFASLKNTSDNTFFNFLIINKLNINNEINISSLKNNSNFITAESSQNVWFDSLLAAKLISK